MLKPDLHVASVMQVSPAWLRERGVLGVLVDVDDTLVPGDDGPVDPAALAWVRDLIDAGIRVAILSNGSVGRVSGLGERLGVPALALVGKPFRFAFRRGLAALGTPASATAMVGDQLFTDVLGARCAGLTAVLVSPLTPGRLPHTRLARRLERWVLAGGNRGGPLDR